jgi:hypothetical protein
MGGNAFTKEFPDCNRRYSAKEYFDLCVEVLPLLQQVSTKFDVIPAYGSKESFGDMDVLCIAKGQWDIARLKQVFNTDKVIHNGPCWSLIYKDFQIDLIMSNQAEYACALSYFSFNDYGNLRGKVVHKFGMKFGHDGLTLPIRTEHHIIGEIVLSRDPDEINQIFGFVGDDFETLEDMFDAVIGSPYFNPAIFAFEEMNCVARIRDKKRSSYNAFLKYIDNHVPTKPYYQFIKDKSVYLEMIFELFPHARPEYDAIMERKRKTELAATLFNGTIITEYTGLSGKELGAFIKHLRLLPELSTVDSIISLSSNTIKHLIMHNL